MKKFFAAVLVFSAAFIFAGCAFMQKKDRAVLEELGRGEYVMLADVEVNAETGAVLRKGDTVTLKIVTGTEWVKVYGYNTALPAVSAPQVLILYMFSTDFKDEKFSMTEFETAFSRFLRRKTAADDKPATKTKR